MRLRLPSSSRNTLPAGTVTASGRFATTQRDVPVMPGRSMGPPARGATANSASNTPSRGTGTNGASVTAASASG